MQRFRKLALGLVLLTLTWYTMLAVHELGHVLGAVLTGGTIQRVVLHPLAISRTDVSPNPRPAIVVWLGPLVGCLLPLLAFALIPSRFKRTKKIAQFVAGFCLIANGAYISLGSFQKIGDCREMFHSGTPQWLMLTFGAATIPLGLYLWHRLGSLRK